MTQIYREFWFIWDWVSLSVLLRKLEIPMSLDAFLLQPLPLQYDLL